MPFSLISSVSVCTLVTALALPLAAQSAAPAAGPGPCEQITTACKNAGFVEGEYKKGYGLHVDCIDPIMHGTKPPAQTDKPLPAISPELVAACKQKNPNFGEGKKAPAK